MRFSVDQIAEACRGSATRMVDDSVAGVSIDSRTVEPGQLFVPLVADRDGHAFIAQAIEAGARAYVTECEPLHDDRAVAIRVADTMDALTALGTAARVRLPDAVIGVTGSVGKTSVKDLLASVLATTFRTASSAKSFNNEIGVPLTLANAAEDSEVLVQEMGARGIGHIRELCGVARPTGAIVTMVAEVHTSEFAGLDEVARGKGELVEAVPADGFVVLNASDERVAAMAERTEARVLGYGAGGDVVAEDVVVDAELRPAFALRSPWGSTEVRLGVHGVHQVANALAAAAAALAQGVGIDAVSAGLADAVLSPWRMELRRTSSGAVVINDAYNANPTAAASALRSLAAIDADRRVAVLGLMAELGQHSEARHAEIGDLAHELGIELITVSCPIYGTGLDVPSAAAALEALGPLRIRDAVLVKASRSVGLETIADHLTA